MWSERRASGERPQEGEAFRGDFVHLSALAFAMLGVEGAATECESPFGDRVNHLAMDAYAALAVANVHEVLRAAVIHAQAPWAIPRLSKEES